MFVAGEKGHGQSLRSLIRGGADVNLPNNRGVTPLQISAKHGHAEVCRTLLLDGGADVHQARFNGITALSVAVHAGHSDVVSVLLTTGGARLNAVSLHQIIQIHSVSCKFISFKFSVWRDSYSH